MNRKPSPSIPQAASQAGSPLLEWASFDDMQQALCQQVTQALSRRLDQDGRARLLCAGGQSPARYLPALARCDLDWSRVDLGLTDERWVPADHPDSNLQFIDRHLRQGAASQARLLPLHTGHARAADALPHLDAQIAQWHEVHPGHDMVLLGMGADTHFASLFPMRPGVQEALDPSSHARIVAVTPGEGVTPAIERVSLTLPELARSRQVVLIIQGQAKRDALLAAWHDAGSAHALHPVSALRQLDGPRAPQLHLWWYPE